MDEKDPGGSGDQRPPSPNIIHILSAVWPENADVLSLHMLLRFI